MKYPQFRNLLHPSPDIAEKILSTELQEIIQVSLHLMQHL